jgi:hypothetical protein
MGIESKWGKCSIIGLIHTFQFSTFVLFVVFFNGSLHLKIKKVM